MTVNLGPTARDLTNVTGSIAIGKVAQIANIGVDVPVQVTNKRYARVFLPFHMFVMLAGKEANAP